MHRPAYPCPARLAVAILTACLGASFANAEQYQLVPANYLDDGNAWNYDAHITKYANQAVNWNWTLAWEIAGSETVAGYPTKIHKQTYRDEGGTPQLTEWDYRDLTAQYMRQIKWRDHENVREVKNSDPGENVPVWLSTSASNQHFGHGTFSTWKAWNPSQVWDYQDNCYITYLGRQTATVPAGAFLCTKAQIRYVWQHSYGDNGTQTYTAWFHEDVGVVKGNVVDRRWDQDDGAWYETVYSQQLRSWRPLPPTGLSASDGAYADRVRLTWNASAGATAYEVWRHTSNNAGSATRITSSATGTTYDDTTAAPGITYWYWLKTKNAHGTSGFSASDPGYRAAPRNTVCVDDSNTTGVEQGSEAQPHNTVQEGIDAVADGGTVKVAQGTYAGSLTIDGKSVTLRGGYPGGSYPGTGNFNDASRNPATNQTVLDGSGSACQIVCQGTVARGSTLDGLTIRNGGAICRGGIVLKRVIAKSGT